MLNGFIFKFFALSSLFNFLIYFFFLFLFFFKNREGLSVFFLKKKTIFFFNTCAWFLVFLPLSIGFFYKLFVFLTTPFLNLQVFFFLFLANTGLVVMYFYNLKSFFFFKKYCFFYKNQYRFYSTLSFNFLSFFLFFFLV